MAHTQKIQIPDVDSITMDTEAACLAERHGFNQVWVIGILPFNRQRYGLSGATDHLDKDGQRVMSDLLRALKDHKGESI